MLESETEKAKAMHCRFCGYDLRGQPLGGRCSECGARIVRPDGLDHHPWRDLGRLYYGCVVTGNVFATVLLFRTVGQRWALTYGLSSFGILFLIASMVDLHSYKKAGQLRPVPLFKCSLGILFATALLFLSVRVAMN